MLVLVVFAIIVISALQGHGSGSPHAVKAAAAAPTTTVQPISVPDVDRRIDRSVARASHRFWIVSVECSTVTRSEWADGNDCVGIDTQNDMPVDVFVTVDGDSVQWVLYSGVQGDETKTPWSGTFTL